METSAAAEIVEITHDVPCIHCGYNLRGLTPGGMCPECGNPIAESLRGDLLRYANSKWLRRVQWGLAIAIFSVGIDIVLQFSAGWLSSLYGPNRVVFSLIWFVRALIAFAAAMFITAREPRTSFQSSGVSLRQMIRTLAGVQTILPTINHFTPEFPSLFWLFGFVTAMLIYIVKFVAELVFLRRLARRVPNKSLERSTTLLVWLAILASVSTFFSVIDGFVSVRAGPFPSESLLSALLMELISWASLWLGHIVSFWSGLLLIWYRSVLRRQMMAHGSHQVHLLRTV